LEGMVSERKHPQFDSLCGRIRAAYKELGHSMSWTFLYTPQSTLHSSQKLFFIALNPAGDKYGYPEEPSCEEGNDYLHGDWDQIKWKRGNAPLQLQVQALFKKIAASMNGNISPETFMDTSLAANYIPFRSKMEKTLVNKERTLVFARALWSCIFSFVQPAVIICIAVDAYNGLKSILQDKGFQLVHPEKGKHIGWGNVTYHLTELSDGNRTVILVRLPHLSRYKVCSNKKCETEIEEITTRIANELNAF
jgi:hypothetical protein